MAEIIKGYAAQVRALESGEDLEEALLKRTATPVEAAPKKAKPRRLAGAMVSKHRKKKATVLPSPEQIAEYNRLGGRKTAAGRAYRRKWMRGK